MSVHVKRRAGGRVVYVVKLRDPAGRQYSRSFRTRREAERFELEQRSAHLQHTWVDPRAGNVILIAYTERWMRQRVGLRPKIVELYQYLLGHHILPGLGQHKLSDLSPPLVRDWHAGLFAKPSIGGSTVAKAYRLLRTILTTAVEDELIMRNPCVLKGASVERPDERPVATVDQIAALADAADPRYRAMILLAAWCGLRFGEAAALAREDIGIKAGTLKVRRQLVELANGAHLFAPPKTSAGKRVIAIPPHVQAEVRHHLALRVGSSPDDLLFPAPDGDLLRRSNFARRTWAPAVRAVGLTGFRFHDLRHTGNTLASSTGASTKELMARMGHATPRAALIYQHATAERDHALAAALSRLAESVEAPPKRLRTVPDEPGCSPNVLQPRNFGRTSSGFEGKTPGQESGDDRIRTDDPLLAKPLAYPLVLAPTGFTRIADPDGELAVARAAHRANLPYTLSTLSTRSIEEVRSVSDGRLWFQIYAWRDRGLVKEMVDRAAAANYEALVLTVDTAVFGRRERDLRRGFSLPPIIGVGTLIDGALHPRWTFSFVKSEPIRFANVVGRDVGDGSSPVTLSDYINSQFDPALSWDDIEWLRSIWDGPIVVKGIQTVADAKQAVERSVDAIALSNHGGRQLDGAPSTLGLVAPVSDAVGGRTEIICDGGIRRGSDIVKAVAAGATAAMAGRAYLYALGAAGEKGVDRVLSWFAADMLRTMSLLGAGSITDLDRAFVDLTHVDVQA